MRKGSLKPMNAAQRRESILNRLSGAETPFCLLDKVVHIIAAGKVQVAPQFAVKRVFHRHIEGEQQ